MWEYNNSNELYHYGVLGMRWGRRKAKVNKSTRKPKRKMSEDAKEIAKIRKKRVSEMSNQELKDVNKRLEAESKYKELTRKKNVGKQVVQAFIATGTTIAAVETAARTYKKVADFAVNKIGKRVVK